MHNQRGATLRETLAATARNVLDELKGLASQNPTRITLDLGQGTCASIWFNAWQYQSSDQIWAGLAEAIVRGITNRLEPIDREKFLLRLHLSRVNADTIRTRIYDTAFRQFVDLLRRLALPGIGGVAILGGILWNLPLAVFSPIMVLTSLAAVAATYISALTRVKNEPAKLNLSDFVDVPDYSEKLGFIHHVTEDLRRVFELLPERDNQPEGVERDHKRRVPLVIFIDDLDRCSPQKVAEVFEAINLFVAGEFPDCYIVIGMDTDVVAAALEEAHKEVIQRLPRYARRVPVGWRFMDKFVQLPFVIPPLDVKAIDDYADYLAASEDSEAREVQNRASGGVAQQVERGIRDSLDNNQSESEIIRQAVSYLAPGSAPESKAMAEGLRLAKQHLESVKRQRYIDSRAREFQNDGSKIQTLLKGAKEDFSHNPRELKRLVNVYRFYYNLRLARLSRKLKVPTEEQMEGWLKLSLAWPEVVRWLRRSYSELESDGGPDNIARTAVGQRLVKLEDFAGSDIGPSPKRERSQIVKDWAGALRKEFQVSDDELPWLDDERLFGFFRASRQSGEHRLSAGAGLGFW